GAWTPHGPPQPPPPPPQAAPAPKGGPIQHKGENRCFIGRGGAPGGGPPFDRQGHFALCTGCGPLAKRRGEGPVLLFPPRHRCFSQPRIGRGYLWKRVPGSDCIPAAVNESAIGGIGPGSL